MKILNIVIALVFAMFAAAQYNDPDGMSWVIIYGVIAVLAGFASLERTHKHFSLGAFILVTGMALLHLPGAIEFFTNRDGISFSDGMANTYPYIEQMREFFGLTLGASGLWAVYVTAARAEAKAKDD